jgi:acetyl esterase/lipase
LLAAGTGGTDRFPVPGADVDPHDRPDAVISFFAPIRVEGVDAEWLAVDADGARIASPIEHVSRDFPAALILNGTSDAMIPHTNSMELFEALHAAGVPVDLRLYAGMTHEFQRLPEMHEHVIDDIVNFLDRHLLHGEPFEDALAERRAFWAERAADRPAPPRA